MEYMDKGSLDGIYKKIGPIDIDIVGQVALAVLEGLTYLYDVHRIIHRGLSQSLSYIFCFRLAFFSHVMVNALTRRLSCRHNDFRWLTVVSS